MNPISTFLLQQSWLLKSNAHYITHPAGICWAADLHGAASGLAEEGGHAL